jgi:hypothetical protein
MRKLLDVMFELLPMVGLPVAGALVCLVSLANLDGYGLLADVFAVGAVVTLAVTVTVSVVGLAVMLAADVGRAVWKRVRG